MQETPTFGERNRIALKAASLTILTLLLLIPASMIRSIVNERSERQDEAFSDIASKWGGTQHIVGPIMAIPYLTFANDQSGKSVQTRRTAYLLPEDLTIVGKVETEKRHRGIYEIPVYRANLETKGKFSKSTLQKLDIAPENFLWNEATIVMGISDLTGIDGKMALNWNGKSIDFEPGSPYPGILESGVHIKHNFFNDEQNDYSFSFVTAVKGSRKLQVAPIGKSTTLDLAGNWDNPSFQGEFIPVSYDLKEGNFNANWKVSNLNRNFMQTFTNDNYDLHQSSMGVDLFMPVDIYQKTERSVKYAILFIALTFLIFFFIELLNKKLFHPLQYILVGFALCLFYTLLLSFSEYLNFNAAYGIATLMTLSLITWYTATVLKSPKLGFLVGATLFILYSFIFTVIQLQDFALLMGSIGLFIVLAVTMYFSRHIDWYGLGNKKPETPPIQD